MKINKISIKELIKEKFILILLLTLPLTRYFMLQADRILTYIMNKKIESVVGIYNYTFGKLGYILVIPAAIISVLFVYLIFNIKEYLILKSMKKYD